MNWPYKFFYSGTIMMLVLFYQHSLLAGLLELMNTDLTSTNSIMSFMFSIFLSSVCALLTVGVTILVLKNAKRGHYPSVNTKFESLSVPMRKKSRLAHIFYPCLLMKFNLSVLTYTIFDSGTFHTISILALESLFLVLLIIARPVKVWRTTLIAIILQVFLVVYFYF